MRVRTQVVYRVWAEMLSAASMSAGRALARNAAFRVERLAARGSAISNLGLAPTRRTVNVIETEGHAPRVRRPSRRRPFVASVTWFLLDSDIRMKSLDELLAELSDGSAAVLPFVCACGPVLAVWKERMVLDVVEECHRQLSGVSAPHE